MANSGSIRSESASEKSRVRWHCRRGMKELDVLLERFVVSEYDHLSSLEHRSFCELLDASDPDLYSMIMGLVPPGDSLQSQLIVRIRGHKKPQGT